MFAWLTARFSRPVVSTPSADLAKSPLSPELLRQIKGIQVRTQRLVTDVLAGEYESAFKGRGMEFEEVRPYLIGDDIRHIDWNVTARTGSPHVKAFREERELTVMLLVDASSSGAFGSQQKLKSEVAAEVAAVLAYTAIRSNDRVGLIIFSDHVEHFVPPRKGRSHVWRVIRDILSYRTSARRRTNLVAALDTLGRVVPRRCVAFLISDFLDSEGTGGTQQGFLERLRVAAARHDVTAVSITDPREEVLPPIGLLELEDAETGEVLLVDSRADSVRDGLRRAAHKAETARRQAFREAGIGEIAIHTDRSYVDPIVRYFRGKEAS